MSPTSASIYLIALTVVCAILFVGLVVIVIKFKRPWKHLPLTALLATIVLVAGNIFWGTASDGYLRSRLQSSVDTVAPLASQIEQELQQDGHKFGKTHLEPYVPRNGALKGLTLAKATPDSRMVTVVTTDQTGAIQAGRPLNEGAKKFATAWQGQPDVRWSGSEWKCIVAYPVRTGGQVSHLLFGVFDQAESAPAFAQIHWAIFSMAAFMLFLVIAGGVASGELFASLAVLRVSKAELQMQGDKIREQMQVIAETNQAMASNQDALAQANSKLKDLATTDGLTGVMNHRTLMEYLSSNMKKNSMIGSPCSVILLDVDNFKQLNDQYGHMAGDDALRTIASVLKQSCPPGAGVGRYGGEEFMMVLPGASESAAIGVADELRRRVQMAPMTSRPCTASFGVSTVYSMNKSEQTLIDEADKALYYAKGKGKNCVIHFGSASVDKTG